MQQPLPAADPKKRKKAASPPADPGIEEALRRRAQELTQLHAVSLDITRALELPTLLEKVVERAAGLLNARGGCLYLCQPELRQVSCVVSYNTFEDYTGVILQYGQGAAGTVAESGEPLIIEDYRVWPKRMPSQVKESSTAMLTVPMLWNGIVIGVLQIMDDAETRRFSQADQELLTLFADQAAIAIENARLLAAERVARAQGETFYQVTNAIVSSLDLNEIIHQILVQLKRVLIFNTASVLLDAGGNRLALVAGIGFQDEAATSQQATLLLQESPILAQMTVDLQPVVIPDVHAHPGWIWVPGAEHVVSFLAVPVIARGQMIGVLMADSILPGFYTPADVRSARLIAQSIAIAVENARLYEAQEKRAAEMEAMHTVSLSVTSSLELEDVLDEILRSTLRFQPDANNAHIFLYHEGVLWFGSALWGTERRSGELSEPRQNGLTYTVARSGEPMVISDMKTHPLYAEVYHQMGWEGAMVGLPLKIAQRVVGVMNIAYNASRTFSESELRMLRLIADQAAIAIENARLYRDASDERRHLQLLFDLGRELAASLDSDDILNRASRLTYKALGGIFCEAYLWMPEQNRLSLRGITGREVESVSELDQALNLTIGKGLIGWVAWKQQGVIVPDVGNDPHWLNVIGLDHDVSSAMVAPILYRNQLLGLFSVLHENKAAFRPDHLQLLEAVCQQTALALNNASRYQEVQHLVDQLALEQNRLLSLIERLPMGVLVLDENYRLLAVNQPGQNILSTLGSGNLGEVLRNIAGCPVSELVERQAEPLPRDIPWEGPPKQVFEARIRPMGGDDHQWVLIIREVTEEREAYARIQMQERLATVGQLAAGIAHDFNNIMAAILVYTDLLMKDIGAFPAHRERINIIQQQVQRASSLIRQILDFSRRSVMEQSLLDTLPFMKEQVRLLKRLLPETIQVEFSARPGNYLVHADPTRLQQVMMNLSLNAVDAMPQGGCLSFQMETLFSEGGEPVAELLPGEWVRLKVSDAGVGIPPEVLPHIFEPFFTTKPVGRGTGLGLAQVYGIVRQHNGFIDVESQIGQGTRFSIYLPVAPAPVAGESTPILGMDLDGKGRLVLLAEDDLATRDALKDLLETCNFRVLGAANGRQALRLFQEAVQPVDLVITDIVMPEMGGFALYQALSESNRGRPVKILFVTGHPLSAEDQALLERGRVHWLQKPFSIREFSDAVSSFFA